MRSLHGLVNRPRSVWGVVAVVLYVVLAAATVAIVRSDPQYALAAGSATALAAELAAGLLLLAAALATPGPPAPARATRRCWSLAALAWPLQEWNVPAARRRCSRPVSLLYAAWPPLLAAAALRGPDERPLSRPAARRPCVRLRDEHRRAGGGLGRGLRPARPGVPAVPAESAADRGRRRRVARPRPGGPRAQRGVDGRRSPRSPSPGCARASPARRRRRRPRARPQPRPRWRCSAPTRCTAAIAAFSPTTRPTARCGPAQIAALALVAAGVAWGRGPRPARAVGARPARGRPRRLARTRRPAGAARGDARRPVARAAARASTAAGSTPTGAP